VRRRIYQPDGPDFSYDPLMRVPFRLVDVFADRPFAGNQLCVVPEPVPLGVPQMQGIAAEVGFSETTFVTAFGVDRYSMRIFTPGNEMPFAGHPTLGTAFVLVGEGAVTSPVTQSVAAGDYVVEVEIERNRARMRQLRATFDQPLTSAHAVAAALRLDPGSMRQDTPPQVVSTGLPHLIVPVADPAAVRAASPDGAALRSLLRDFHAEGCYVFAIAGGRAKARCFAPGVAVDEDPGTGSAAGPLGAYCCEHGLTEPGRLLISQGEEIGRPCSLVVDVESEDGGWRPVVGGGVFVVGSGAFQLPD
jgi:trans-2,3-dihydro-3-hydroxyanthranilate isomerase